MKRILLPVLLLASASYAAADPSEPGDIGIEIGLGLSGLYVAPTYDFSGVLPGLHGRLPLTFGELSYEEKDENNNIIKGIIYLT